MCVCVCVCVCTRVRVRVRVCVGYTVNDEKLMELKFDVSVIKLVEWMYVSLANHLEYKYARI